jgi:hypothetical protein
VKRAPQVLLAGGLLAAAAFPLLDHLAATREVSARLGRVSAAPAMAFGGAALDDSLALPSARGAGLLASWETVGGCGAGASTGTGGGVKWIGRSATGGLFDVQCQGNYMKMDDGYQYALTTQINRNLGDKWSLGVSVPWLYKYWVDPQSLGFDLSHEGFGDVTLLGTRRLGAINDTSVTLSVGLPTGRHDGNYMEGLLRQDKQLGHGKFTGGLQIDHTLDNIWGPVVFGGTVNYRGGENELQAYRAPAASIYSYAGYVMGPFTPAAGLSVNGTLSEDRSEGRVQETPLLTISANASVEWATDYFAVLAGTSLPFDRAGNLQPWVVAVGLSLSPF